MSETEAKVQSPCVRNCCLDDDEVCLGCARTLAEIVAWNEATEAQRQDILARVRQCREAREAGLRR